MKTRDLCNFFFTMIDDSKSFMSFSFSNVGWIWGLTENRLSLFIQTKNNEICFNLEVLKMFLLTHWNFKTLDLQRSDNFRATAVEKLHCGKRMVICSPVCWLSSPLRSEEPSLVTWTDAARRVSIWSERSSSL